MLRNSSGTAVMISTSLGAFCRQYLAEACSAQQLAAQDILTTTPLYSMVERGSVHRA